MIHNLIGIANIHVTVVYDIEFKTIMLQSNQDSRIQYFSEYTDMEILFKDLRDEFTESLEYDDVYNFLKPMSEV